MRMNLLEETMNELGNDHITSPVVAVIDNDASPFTSLLKER